MRLTLPRLFGWAFCFVCGGFLGLALRSSWGWTGFVVGFLLGTSAGICVLWGVLLGRLLVFFPLPICRQGKCRGLGKDFVWETGTIYGYQGKGVYRYKCGCGDQYVRRGNRFMEFLSDGTTRPYKKLVGLRKWADERDQ